MPVVGAGILVAGEKMAVTNIISVTNKASAVALSEKPGYRKNPRNAGFDDVNCPPKSGVFWVSGGEIEGCRPGSDTLLFLYFQKIQQCIFAFPNF